MTYKNTRGASQTGLTLPLQFLSFFHNNPLSNPNTEVFRIFEWKYDQILTIGVL